MIGKLVRGAGMVTAGALLLAAAGPGAAVAADKDKSGSSTSTTLNQTKATKEATAAFVTLFNSNDKNAKAREALLQSAPKYKAKFNKLFTSAVAKANPTVVQVTKVAFPGTAACKAAVNVATCAAVTYNIDTATTGAALLSGQSGYAVYVGGKWDVADATFCSLAKLAGASC